MNSRIPVTADIYQFLVDEIDQLEKKLLLLQQEELVDQAEDNEDGFVNRRSDQETPLELSLLAKKAMLKECRKVPKPVDNQKIQIGHQVTIRINGAIKTFLFNGLSVKGWNICSQDSPLGRKLLGAQVGGLINLGDQTIEIIKIF